MKKILILMLALSLILAFTGCKTDETQTTGSSTTKTQETQAGDTTEATGTVVMGDGENTIVIGGGEWPEDAPDKIPVFDKGTINGTVMTPAGQAIAFEDVNQDDFDQYIDDLSDAGWNQLTHVTDDGTEVFMGQMDEMIVTVEWSAGEMMIIWAGM